MAQIMNWWENFKTDEHRQKVYQEGPFVAVCIDGWRVECEVKDHKCPALPHDSIFHFLNKWKFTKGTKEECCKIVDKLNTLAKQGIIILSGKCWIRKIK